METEYVETALGLDEKKNTTLLLIWLLNPKFSVNLILISSEDFSLNLMIQVGRMYFDGL